MYIHIYMYMYMYRCTVLIENRAVLTLQLYSSTSGPIKASGVIDCLCYVHPADGGQQARNSCTECHMICGVSECASKIDCTK